MVLNENSEPKYVLGKQYSSSALKSFKKDELIELLNIAQHNYECVNERLYNVSKCAENLDEALKDAVSILCGDKCPHNCGYPCRETGIEDCQLCWTKYFGDIYLIGDEE